MKRIYHKMATLPLLAILMCFSNSAAAATNCSAGKYAEIRAVAASGGTEVFIDCNATLNSNDFITKLIRFEGNASNGVVFDCNGAQISPLGLTSSNDAIEIKPKKISSQIFERPENITVKNCKINGSVRLNTSFLSGGNAAGSAYVSQIRNTVAKNITLDNLTITSNLRVPVFFHAGVTYSKLINSKIINHTDKVSLYLARESGRNLIENNEFHSNSDKREILAVDASDNNVITRNWFTGLSEGGIYMYRNCGEGGTIRYTTPSHNEITDNIFYYNNYNGSNPGIYIGSRNGNKNYCPDDAGWFWNYDGVQSSSSDDRDFARDNTITGNKICNRSPNDVIKVGFTVNTPNTITGNSEITCNSSTPIPRPEPGGLLVTLSDESTGLCAGSQELFFFDATASGSEPPYTFTWSGVSQTFSSPTDNPNTASLTTSGSASVLVEVTGNDGKTANKSITVNASCSGQPF